MQHGSDSDCIQWVRWGYKGKRFFYVNDIIGMREWAESKAKLDGERQAKKKKKKKEREEERMVRRWFRPASK